MDKKHIAWILLTFAMAFWGMSFVWTRQLLNDFSPISIITIRLVISTVFLVILSVSIKKLQKIKKSDIKYFLLISLFEPFLYFVFEGYGIKATSASFAAIIIATIPLFTPLGTRLFFKERLSIMNFTGMFISFSGVALIIFNKTDDSSFSIFGLILLLGAVFSAVGYFLILKKVVDRYNSYSIATWQNFFGILYFVPLFFSMSLGDFKSIEITKDIIYAFIALSILASSIAFIFYTYGIRELGPSKAAAFINSVPVFTVIFAYFILNESIDIYKMVGMTVVIIGLFLAQKTKKK